MSFALYPNVRTPSVPFPAHDWKTAISLHNICNGRQHEQGWQLVSLERQIEPFPSDRLPKSREKKYIDNLNIINW
jgi:hypothetical protein